MWGKEGLNFTGIFPRASSFPVSQRFCLTQLHTSGVPGMGSVQELFYLIFSKFCEMLMNYFLPFTVEEAVGSESWLMDRPGRPGFEARLLCFPSVSCTRHTAQGPWLSRPGFTLLEHFLTHSSCKA